MKVFDFLTQTKKEYPLDYSILQQTQLTGHGGADYYLMDSFIQAVAVSNFIIIKDPLLLLLILNSTSLSLSEGLYDYCNGYYQVFASFIELKLFLRYNL